MIYNDERQEKFRNLLENNEYVEKYAKWLCEKYSCGYDETLEKVKKNILMESGHTNGSTFCTDDDDDDFFDCGEFDIKCPFIEKQDFCDFIRGDEWKIENLIERGILVE